MTITSSWNSHIETFVDISSSSAQQNASRDAIAALLKNEFLTLEALIKEMGLYLTTTDHVLRGRGILLLAELLKCLASKPLDKTTVHSLVVFFTEKLADWQVLHGPLIGCLALLRRQINVGMVADSDARSLARSYVQNIQVQSLGKHDRKLCFEILSCLLNHHPDVVATLEDDLFYGLIEAIEGEKDPECLMLMFHVVADLFRLFPDPFGPVADLAEELFDVLGRYFPVHFTHPNDDFNVKREDLSRALMLAFASSPLFEPFAIPLLLEKLSSSLPVAKVDSLKYLTTCSVKYGADIMAKHAKSIWSSLKDAIFSSLEQNILSRLSKSPDDMDLPDSEIAKEALLCVQDFMLQEDGLFMSLILEDDDLLLMLRSSTAAKSYNDISVANKQMLYPLGCLLWASAKVSHACCNKLFHHVFSRLMDTLGLSAKCSGQSCVSVDSVVSEKMNFGALYLCSELLAASRTLSLSSKEPPVGTISVEGTWYGLLKKFCGPLTEVLHFVLVSSTNQDVSEADIYCGVKSLQVLATYPHCFLSLSESTFESILGIFMSILTNGCEGTLLWKLAVKALMEIGEFTERFHDSEKASTYMAIVVEKVVLLLLSGESAVPLALQLEAISGIGTSGLKFMLPVTEGLEAAISTNFLEACVKGSTKSDKSLVSLLECYSTKVLPWYDKHKGFEDVAVRFSVNIWNQIECNNNWNVGDQGKDLLDRMMIAMKLAVAGCSESTQGLILQKAYSVLSSSTIFILNKSYLTSVPTKIEELQLSRGSNTLSSRDKWITYLFASVIIALRPQTPLENARGIWMFFTSLLFEGHLPVAQGLGSIVNKLPSSKSITDLSSAFTLEESMDIALKKGLFGSTPKKCSSTDDVGENLIKDLDVSDTNLIQSSAIAGLAWIGKGLVMRGNERMKDIMMMLLRYLLTSNTWKTSLLPQHMLQDSSEQIPQSAVIRSAADAFHVLLSDSDDCLNKRFHAMVKPLYKQHFFYSVKPILLTAIKESDSATRSMLYRALGNVISSTPLAAVVTEAKTLIFILLDGISMLSVDVHDKDLMFNLLLVLSAMIMDENGREAVIENAHIIVNRLIELMFYPHMMLVRETGIQCLVAMSGLPHTRIFPMRAQVLHALEKALDDPKRTVRQEAVRCRQAWASIASRSVHF